MNLFDCVLFFCGWGEILLSNRYLIVAFYNFLVSVPSMYCVQLQRLASVQTWAIYIWRQKNSPHTFLTKIGFRGQCHDITKT